jgi:hypothetical protein
MLRKQQHLSNHHFLQIEFDTNTLPVWLAQKAAFTQQLLNMAKVKISKQQCSFAVQYICGYQCQPSYLFTYIFSVRTQTVEQAVLPTSIPSSTMARESSSPHRY